MSEYRALITGGGRGIGRGVALALGDRGFSIAVNALAFDADVEATLAALRERGVKAEAVIGDVADLVAPRDDPRRSGARARPADHSHQQRRRQRPAARRSARRDARELRPLSGGEFPRGLLPDPALGEAHSGAACAAGRASLCHHDLVVERGGGLDCARRILRLQGRRAR